jgi:hypothetical protein
MNLRALEEAFLEDLYDERRKLRVELPSDGFVFYATPSSQPRAIWQVCLDSQAVAEAYMTRTDGKLPVWELEKLIKQVRIKNVTSARTRQTIASARPLRVVGGEDDARRQMIKHISQWIGDNFGHESRDASIQLAGEALALLRDGREHKMARGLAQQARRWFPTFWDAIQREVPLEAVGT